MTNVIPMFDFNGVRLRGTIIDNQPWFVAKDVCECAGLALGGGPTQHLRMLDKDEKGRGTFPTPGGRQQMTVVSEAGLYKLIQRSSKPEAKAFDRWVRHEVLPSTCGAWSSGATAGADRFCAKIRSGIAYQTEPALPP